MDTGRLYIDGSWATGTGEHFASTNPATGETVWSGHSASNRDVGAAVTAARSAFYSWSIEHTLSDRIAIVERFGDAVRLQADRLADLITAETGKARWDTAGEAASMAAKVEISIAAYHERTGTTVRPLGLATSITRHKPHGVLAVFGAYNFPGHLPNGHIVPALIAGNTIVFKPSELAPAVGEEAVRIWESVGLPAGVLNLVQGALPTGQALAKIDEIDGLLFTGSATVGAYLHEQFGGQPGKVLALEMGGNNPLIFSDASDLDAAVANTIQSAFVTSGQRCTCARRLLVPLTERGDEFLDRLVETTARLAVGDPTSDVFMGPVISDAAARRLLDGYGSIVDAGAEVLLPMKPMADSGAFVTPGIVDATGLELPDEEHFGPLLTVYRYREFDDAVALANRTRFGLAAGIFTEDPAVYERFWAASNAGIVNWNRPLTGASSGAPFGGTGASGNHQPSAYYAADYVAYPVASLEAPALEPLDLRGLA